MGSIIIALLVAVGLVRWPATGMPRMPQRSAGTSPESGSTSGFRADRDTWQFRRAIVRVLLAILIVNAIAAAVLAVLDGVGLASVSLVTMSLLAGSNAAVLGLLRLVIGAVFPSGAPGSRCPRAVDRAPSPDMSKRRKSIKG